jgi:uncharacterized protein
MNTLPIQLLAQGYSLCTLNACHPIPAWVASSYFYSITKTNDELSIVCQSNVVPTLVQQDAGWRIIQIAAVLDLTLTGITAKFSTALASVGVNLCVIATYHTDYIMVKEEKLAIAITALAAAGFTLI